MEHHRKLRPVETSERSNGGAIKVDVMEHHRKLSTKVGQRVRMSKYWLP